LRSDVLLVTSTSPGKSQKVRSWPRARPILACSSPARSHPVGARQKGFELFFQLSLFSRQGRGREVRAGSGEIERLSQPELEPEGQIIRTLLERERERRVARQMRQTCLMPRAVTLLGRIAIRYPDRRHMPSHHLLHDAGGAGIVRLMRDRVLAVENPVIRVRSLDPNPGLVAGDNLGGAKKWPWLSPLRS
jgi:hypothetical protein